MPLDKPFAFTLKNLQGATDEDRAIILGDLEMRASKLLEVTQPMDDPSFRTYMEKWSQPRTWRLFRAVLRSGNTSRPMIKPRRQLIDRLTALLDGESQT